MQRINNIMKTFFIYDEQECIHILQYLEKVTCADANDEFAHGNY